MNTVSIMIIDDEYGDRYILKRTLKESKYTGKIFESENGQEALNFLKDYKQKSKEYPDGFPPVLIFLDINMHVMGGFEFLDEFSKLRQGINEYQTCIFTMFTSSDRDEDRKRAESHDFVKGFITKGSFELEDFHEILRKYFPDMSVEA